MPADRGALARTLALAIVAMLPLAAWPGLERPFSTPKLALLVAGVLTCAALTWGAGDRLTSRPRSPHTLGVVVFAWLVPWAVASLFGEFVSGDATALGVFVALWVVVLARTGADGRDVAIAQVLGTTGVALVTLLQAAGADPFVAAGWVPAIAGASPRLAIYGTLGNPNFVAALMAGTAPLTVWLCASAASGRPRGLAASALALQLAAIAATGSRGGALGLATGAVALPLLLPGRRAAALALAGLTVGGVLVVTSSARPLDETLSGRAYIWRVAWRHALERPLAGYGPGAFAVVYPAWERDARLPGDRGASPAAFAGPQQHAHNDYLEALVERGLPGAASLVAAVWAALAAAWRARGDRASAAGAASVAALAAVALVDFPLARPAEAALFWTAVSVAVQERSQEDA